MILMSTTSEGITDQQARNLARYLILKSPWLHEWGVIVQTNRTLKIQNPFAQRPEPRPYVILTVVNQVGTAQVLLSRAKNVLPDLGAALLGTGSCILLGVATATGVAATPVTGGGSMALAVLTKVGAGASAASAGLAWGRVINGMTDPELNEILDSQLYYDQVAMALDLISIGTLSASRFPALFAIYRESKRTGKSVVSLLRGMNRASRKRVAQELMAATNASGKGISKDAIAAVIRKELLETVATALSVVNSGATGSINRGIAVTTALVN